jgi:hypothetical protein
MSSTESGDDMVAAVLDVFPRGSPEDDRPQHQKQPLAYALGVDEFHLYELTLEDDTDVSFGDRIDLTEFGRDDEVEFDRIRTHIQEAIEESKERGDEVAVDITPGRKFMSAIAFAAGMRYGADHVYYFYLSSYGSYSGLYPEIPRTAVELYDFVEGT